MKEVQKFCIFAIFSLSIVNSCWKYVTAQDTSEKSMSTNCSIRDYNNVVCIGNFNLNQFLRDRRHSGNLTNEDSNAWDNQLSNLEILNSTTLETIDESGFQFHNFTFEKIFIQNAPNLKSIRPRVLFPLKDRLTDFRAIQTNLPNYNSYDDDANPFQDFSALNEVYIGEQPTCPMDQRLLWPCTCEFGKLGRAIPTGLWSTSGGTLSVFGARTEINCKNDTLTGKDLKKIFERFSASTHSPKYFDVLNLEGSNIASLPASVFSNVSFTAVWMRELSNLRSIDENAFLDGVGVSKSIQILEIETANFTAANEEEVVGFLRAMSSLSNIRSLRLSKCGVQYIPAYAFGRKMYNLRYLSLSFDRKAHASGIRSIGSYAFTGAPNLIAVGLIQNFIEKIEPFAFAVASNGSVHERSRVDPLVVEIGGNPINDKDGLKENAFSGGVGKRALHIKYHIDSFSTSDPANTPNFNYFPENVFRPFIQENKNNYFEVDYHNVDIWCDCGNKWMFGDDGVLKKNVQSALQIKRVEDNTVSSEPLSILCKSESSFTCLPKCLLFPLSSLIHCGGIVDFDVSNTLEKFAKYLANSTEILNLKFSVQGVKEIPKNAFGGFQFKNVHFTGCKNLTSIHPKAFGESVNTIQFFSAANTSLTHYPNFGNFPNLEEIQLDDHHPYHITKETFDFSKMDANETFEVKTVNIFMDNGTIDESSFTNLNNNTNIVLNIGKNRECDTMGCYFRCKPSQLKIEEKIFKPFLLANSNNQIKTKCYLECACVLKWMYEQWGELNSQVEIWFREYFGSEFYCVPPGKNILSGDGIFGLDPTQFDNGTYFTKNC